MSPCKGVFQLEATLIDVKNMDLHRDSNPGPWNTFQHRSPIYNLGYSICQILMYNLSAALIIFRPNIATIWYRQLPENRSISIKISQNLTHTKRCLTPKPVTFNMYQECF